MGILTCALTTLALAAPPNSDWSNDYGTALAECRQQQRPMIVVLEKPNEPQHRVEQVSIGANSGEAALLKNYVLCRVDVTTETGRKVAQSFQAESFPHTAVIERTGQWIVHRQDGQFSQEEWLTMLVAYRAAAKSEATVVDCPRCRRW